jgi:hypothetical protein
MRDVDPIRIRDLLGNIADAQRRLRELGQLSEADFVGDYRNTESAKYLLIVAQRPRLIFAITVNFQLNGLAVSW